MDSVKIEWRTIEAIGILAAAPKMIGGINVIEMLFYARLFGRGLSRKSYHIHIEWFNRVETHGIRFVASIENIVDAASQKFMIIDNRILEGNRYTDSNSDGAEFQSTTGSDRCFPFLTRAREQSPRSETERRRSVESLLLAKDFACG